MPGVIANLVTGLGSGRKLYISQKAITGTGTFSPTLAQLESGGVVLSVVNSGAVAPFDVASVSQVSGAAFDVIVVQLTGSGAIKETGAIQVNAWAVGW